MSATNHTKNYNLTQFLPTDKPSWESDYNSDMEKIDTALKDISEKPGIPGPQGEPGKNGENGENGADGKSAYQIAVENGFEGTEEAWLASLKGKDGKNGTDGTNGTDGENGQSAYQIAVNNGFVGSEEEWLASLKGKDGTDATVDITQEEGASTTAVMSQDATTKGMQGIREKIVSDLLSYYTKAEVDQMISAIPKFAIAVVETLPTENISATTVYLVPSGESSPNLYKEYIYVDGKWESLGEQSVDLSDYYTKSQASELFVPQTRTVNGRALSANINIAIPEKTSQLQNDSGYVTNTKLTTELNKKQNKVTVGRVRIINQHIDMNGDYIEIPSISINIPKNAIAILEINASSNTTLVTSQVYGAGLRIKEPDSAGVTITQSATGMVTSGNNRSATLNSILSRDYADIVNQKLYLRMPTGWYISSVTVSVYQF